MSRWQEIVRAELRKAGPTREEKRAAMKRASEIYHGRGEKQESRRNPAPGSDWLTLGLVLGGLVVAANVVAKLGASSSSGCPACGGGRSAPNGVK